MRALFLALLLTSPAGSFAGPRAPADLPRPGLDSFYLLQGLGRVAHHDAAGLGEEAARAQRWAAGREALGVVRSSDGSPALSDGVERVPISPELGRACERLTDYSRLSARARLEPVQTGELRQSLLAPETVRRIRRAFDQAIAEAIMLDGEPVVPELGGDALLVAGALELRLYEDPTRPALRAVAAHRGDPEALAALFAEGSEALALLDVHGQLEREVALHAQRAERGVPLERRRRPLALAVETILRNGSDTFTMHPRAQLEAIFRHEWDAGRLVGAWHLHPPGWSPGGFTAAAPPSPDDRQVARAGGQFLTIVFRPDGFDLHDLQTTPFGPAPPSEPGRLIEHRSERWRRHFAARHADWVRRLRDES